MALSGQQKFSFIPEVILTAIQPWVLFHCWCSIQWFPQKHHMTEECCHPWLPNQLHQKYVPPNYELCPQIRRCKFLFGGRMQYICTCQGNEVINKISWRHLKIRENRSYLESFVKTGGCRTISVASSSFFTTISDVLAWVLSGPRVFLFAIFTIFTQAKRKKQHKVRLLGIPVRACGDYTIRINLKRNA